jgi:hypothetical protein
VELTRAERKKPEFAKNPGLWVPGREQDWHAAAGKRILGERNEGY